MPVVPEPSLFACRTRALTAKVGDTSSSWFGSGSRFGQRPRPCTTDLGNPVSGSAAAYALEVVRLVRGPRPTMRDRSRGWTASRLPARSTWYGTRGQHPSGSVVGRGWNTPQRTPKALLLDPPRRHLSACGDLPSPDAHPVLRSKCSSRGWRSSGSLAENMWPMTVN